jgi:ATP phosphoribosyltransferase regulatory subunit HisZ
MQHPLPSGTRDVLPDEMRELRAITQTLHGVLEARGYGEVYTPAIEFEDPDAGAGASYRFFDESGAVLALRSDMTVPIARVVASRYATAEPPLRLCYFAHAYRAVRPHLGLAREMLQAGIELVGAPAPEGTAEAIEVLCAALDAVGLEGYRIGVGDASLFPALLADVPEASRAQILHELVTRDFVGLERELTQIDRPELLTVAQTRGGPEVLDTAGAEGLKALHGLLSDNAAERVIYDLGLTRELGYYTGAIFEVFDSALGQPIGGGGRYDDLLARHGRDLPAVGWALTLERVHLALIGERS